MNSREVLEQEIEHLEKELKRRKTALRALIENETLSQVDGSPATRFVNFRPLDAIREVLAAHGKPMRADDLRRVLNEGGLSLGKKRPLTNFIISVRVNAETGALVRSGKGNTIADNEMISLPEWTKKK